MTVATENGATEPKVEPAKTEAGATNATAKFTLTRASSIGWYFIESYYELYNKAPENLYKLYNPEASLTHGETPSISKSVAQASTTKSIKGFFSELKSKEVKNKIIVINADIQISLNDNILIVVVGEWSKNDLPYCQFNQTFLLSKGVNDSNYDIANDVLRFLDYDFNHDKIVEKQSVKKPDTETEPVEETEKTEKTEQPAEGTEAPVEKTETKTEKSEQSEPVKEPVREITKEIKETEQNEEIESASAPASSSNTEEASPSSSPDLEDPFNEATSPVSTPASTATSWADLAAKAKDKTPTASRSPSVTTATVKPVKKPVAPVIQPNALPNGKYKKEDWFPIYVRGCEDLKEHDIKEHLTKNFGKIKFIKQNSNIALIDFMQADGQRKALDARKTVINDVTIFLEVRESKAGRKDFKVKEKPNGTDIKRKIEKKPLPKKK